MITGDKDGPNYWIASDLEDVMPSMLTLFIYMMGIAVHHLIEWQPVKSSAGQQKFKGLQTPVFFSPQPAWSRVNSEHHKTAKRGRRDGVEVESREEECEPFQMSVVYTAVSRWHQSPDFINVSKNEQRVTETDWTPPEMPAIMQRLLAGAVLLCVVTQVRCGFPAFLRSLNNN